MTAKDKIAIQKGYPSWKEMENFIIDHNKPVVVAQLLVGAMDEVLELERERAMRWIKASERLPERGQYVFAKDKDGNKYSLFYNWHGQLMNQFNKYNGEIVEWLDETHAHPTADYQKALEQERLKAKALIEALNWVKRYIRDDAVIDVINDKITEYNNKTV